MTDRQISRRAFGAAGLATVGGLVLAGLPEGASRADAATVTPAATVADRILFHGGSESLNGLTYHSFRIPSVVRTKAGTLLAFAEGRAANANDWGNINTVVKRSTDNGATWSKLGQVVGDGEGTWGNPTAVADLQTGTVWVFLCWNPAGYSQPGTDGTKKITEWSQRQVFLSHSTDDGKTWAKPVNLSSSLKPKKFSNGATWAFDAVGPGVGIQTTVHNPGRLVIPAQGRNFYSDDHGKTWKLALLKDTSGKAMDTVTSESTILELADGRLYRNDRPTGSTWESRKRRQVAFGSLEKGFTPFASDNTLLDPKCEGSTLVYTGANPNRIIFSNPASTVQRADKMELRISYDSGRTWPISRSLNDRGVPGGSGYRVGGYSSMAKTADYTTLLLVESSGPGGHQSIDAMKIPLSWILNGHKEP